MEIDTLSAGCHSFGIFCFVRSSILRNVGLIDVIDMSFDVFNRPTTYILLKIFPVCFCRVCVRYCLLRVKSHSVEHVARWSKSVRFLGLKTFLGVDSLNFFEEIRDFGFLASSIKGIVSTPRRVS